MPGISDIVKDSVVEFSRLQDWMISAKDHGDMDTYNMMYKRYTELEVILAAASVTITEIDTGLKNRIELFLKKYTAPVYARGHQ